MNPVYIAVAVLAIVAQAYSQCLPTCATGVAPLCAPSCGCPAPTILAAPAPIVSPTVIAPNSVAATLADTLSLLTVSTLLAEKLPYGYPLVAAPPVYPGCGCGYGYVL